jgi:hypothetical protein
MGLHTQRFDRSTLVVILREFFMAYALLVLQREFLMNAVIFSSFIWPV